MKSKKTSIALLTLLCSGAAIAGANWNYGMVRSITGTAGTEKLSFETDDRSALLSEDQKVLKLTLNPAGRDFSKPQAAITLHLPKPLTELVGGGPVVLENFNAGGQRYNFCNFDSPYYNNKPLYPGHFSLRLHYGSEQENWFTNFDEATLELNVTELTDAEDFEYSLSISASLTKSSSSHTCPKDLRKNTTNEKVDIKLSTGEYGSALFFKKLRYKRD